MKQIFALFILLLTIFSSTAQESSEAKTKNIFENLATPDSITGGVAVIKQDARIEALMIEGSSANTSSSVGYRVQVFSSNTQRTAKNEAYKIEKELRGAFPEYMVYVTYSAPFWKVRIGDFRTLDQAQELRSEIVKTFPALRSDTYAVRDHVNL